MTGEVGILKRRRVGRSDRIRLTEAFIERLCPSVVLELGAGDYSFDYAVDATNVFWTRADFAEPCDVLCDFNSPSAVLPFRSATFDLVVCTEVLEHLLWPQHLLEEAHRVLSAKGTLIVSVPNAVSLTYRISWLLGRLPSCAAGGNLPANVGGVAYENRHGDLIAGHVVDFNRKRLVRLLERSGFEVVKVQGAGLFWHRQIAPHWLLPANLSSNIICVGRRR